VSANQPRLVLTNLPDAERAERLAKDLVTLQLAACVNVLAPCRSYYMWQGALQEDGEIPLLIKTTAKLYPAVEAYIQTHHPYDLPEIIALNIESGLPDYLRWVSDSVAVSAPTSVDPASTSPA
jgi:periplasmic divalent cation tolerance protein